MVNGYVYSIEPFLTTGSGQINYDNENTNLFNINYNNKNNVRKIVADRYLTDIYKKYKYLPFLLDNMPSYYIDNNIITKHPPIYEYDQNAMVSHFERTFYLDEKPVLL